VSRRRNEHIARSQRPRSRKIHHDVAVGVGATEVIEFRALAAKVDLHVILERHVRKSRLRVYEQAVTRTARHVLARLLGRDHLNVHLLHLDVAASVVRVVMRINHISDRLVGDLLQLRPQAPRLRR